ncbi:MAG: S24 family peptidase [Halieaceae bacterium]|jgi:repressor LexA|nr:S24 family peptidase [Halieaceae bacterium]
MAKSSLLIQRRHTTRIVVALINGEAATLKRLYREGATVRLQPAHADLLPLRYPAEAVALIGVVVVVLRDGAG